MGSERIKNKVPEEKHFALERAIREGRGKPEEVLSSPLRACATPDP